jgi:hypothetical protein
MMVAVKTALGDPRFLKNADKLQMLYSAERDTGMIVIHVYTWKDSGGNRPMNSFKVLFGNKPESPKINHKTAHMGQSVLLLWI